MSPWILTISRNSLAQREKNQRGLKVSPDAASHMPTLSLSFLTSKLRTRGRVSQGASSTGTLSHDGHQVSRHASVPVSHRCMCSYNVSTENSLILCNKLINTIDISSTFLKAYAFKLAK